MKLKVYPGSNSKKMVLKVKENNLQKLETLKTMIIPANTFYEQKKM